MLYVSNYLHNNQLKRLCQGEMTDIHSYIGSAKSSGIGKCCSPSPWGRDPTSSSKQAVGLQEKV